jgi:small subunit ribosomal protein S6
MFIFNPALASDYQQVEQEVNRLMQRAGAEVLMSRKWDERKLAFEIKGAKRGLYHLTFFKAPTNKIVGLERDVRISETVLRALILEADYMDEERMNAAYLTRSESSPEGERPERGERGERSERPEGPSRRSEARESSSESDDSDAGEAVASGVERDSE